MDATKPTTRPGRSWVYALKQFKYDMYDFPRYVMGSPFKGFGDIKLEGQGKTYVGVIFLVLYALVTVLRYYYTGFVANRNDPQELNILLTMATAVAPILLFMVGNWSITTLMDGSGSMRDIFLALTYSLFYMIPLQLIYIVLSNVLVQEEMAFATFFITLGWVLYAIYAFIGVVTVHDFGLLRGIAAVILSFFAILIMLFIAMLLASLAGEVLMFIRTVYRELVLNLS